MDNSNNKKKDTKVFKVINKRLVIVLLLLVITIISGTFAWYTYQSKKSALVLTIGDITDARVVLKPYQINETMVPVNTYENQVYTQVEVNTSSDIELSLYYKINELSTELVNNGLKYTIVQSTSANGTYSLVKTGDFKSYTDNKLDILTVELSSNTYYRIYVWLDSSVGTQSNLQNLSLDIELNGTLTSLGSNVYSEAILNGADPVLETGMIPVTIANDGAVATADTSSEWYSYEDKQWANAVLVNSTNRANYYESDGTTIKSNTTVNKDDILAYYVWVPRYRYAFPKADGNPESISIIFEDADTNKSTGTATGTSYYTHPAFTFGTDELNGIWVGKFEMTGTRDNPTILPNEESLYGVSSIWEGQSYKESTINTFGMHNTTKDNLTTLAGDASLAGIGDYFAVSLKFSGGTQSGSTVSFTGSATYGLTANTNAHMMKNSEWGAVAYLSHSAYGINGEIRYNNNSAKLTGCGAATSSTTSYTSTCTLAYGSGISEYPQSTTGNISGIFDMSGGLYEYVMGSYNAMTNSYFSTLPDSKYYDLYPSSQFAGDSITNTALCTLATCGGHALNETKGWYSAISYFVYSSYPWFMRGGYYGNGSSAGVFYFSSSNGNSDGYYGFRSVSHANGA